MPKLSSIQKGLEVPKGQFNSFGKYRYRSCEDIVEAVKPLLCALHLHLRLSDEIVLIGERYYVKATAEILEEDKVVASATAYAREPEQKKGMDESQITGTASSYARKYALNGLLAIDDAKDADTDEHAIQENDGELPWYNDLGKHRETMEKRIEAGESAEAILESIKQKYRVNKKTEQQILDLGKISY